MKKLVAFALCALMVFSVFANGEKETTAAKADGPVTLVYAEVNPLDTIVGMTAQYFKEQVETLTNGSVIIDIQASGVLGSENDVLDGMMGGATTVDISRISAFALTGYGAKKSMLLSLLHSIAASHIFQPRWQLPLLHPTGLRQWPLSPP